MEYPREIQTGKFSNEIEYKVRC